ncbi:hypothetical protein BB561_000304 [Smittium simulii]|uniref:NADH-cytochrome b5 reductase n=1 Tax=Smittium simulii TaxID=133385 RepID=A0A2T9YZQ8_9FUNG|nr:hypothetical protein BB561_000304 [Smittium simulii]
MSTQSVSLVFLSTATAICIAIIYHLLSAKKKPIALDPTSFKAFQLISKTQMNSNTFHFIFDLKNKDAVLGLGLGQCIVIRAKNPIDGKLVTRSYTPISRLDATGKVELLIKVYPKGIVTNVMKNMEIGDSIEMRGPKGNFSYTPNTLSKILMIAGGSGITPMYQVINEIIRDPTDKTKITLLYANIAHADILLHKELDELAEMFSERLEICYVLEKEPENWNGEVGFITKDIITKYTEKVVSNTKALLCGPLPMIKAMETHLVDIGFEPAKIISKPQDHIFKF